MSRLVPNQHRPIAWNGVSMLAPAAWHPAVILNSSLVFEEGYTPVLALKWQRLKGPPSPDRLLDAWQKQASGCRFSPAELPSGWCAALARFPAKGFIWSHHQYSGRGAFLFSPESGLGLFLQTYAAVDEADPRLLALLASLTDHSALAEQPWAMFDIEASLPCRAALSSHQFVPGRFTLTFDLGKDRITLLRFKPATVLLRQQRLHDFGKPLAGSAVALPLAGCQEVDWILPEHRCSRLRALFRRKPAVTRLRLRHVEEGNAILGIRAEGRRPPDRLLFDHISSRFRLLPLPFGQEAASAPPLP